MTTLEITQKILSLFFHLPSFFFLTPFSPNFFFLFNFKLGLNYKQISKQNKFNKERLFLATLKHNRDGKAGVPTNHFTSLCPLDERCESVSFKSFGLTYNPYIQGKKHIIHINHPVSYHVCLAAVKSQY